MSKYEEILAEAEAYAQALTKDFALDKQEDKHTHILQVQWVPGIRIRNKCHVFVPFILGPIGMFLQMLIPDKVGTIQFTTWHPITQEEANDIRKRRLLYYPPFHSMHNQRTGNIYWSSYFWLCCRLHAR